MHEYIILVVMVTIATAECRSFGGPAMIEAPDPIDPTQITSIAALSDALCSWCRQTRNITCIQQWCNQVTGFGAAGGQSSGIQVDQTLGGMLLQPGLLPPGVDLNLLLGNISTALNGLVPKTLAEPVSFKKFNIQPIKANKK